MELLTSNLASAVWVVVVLLIYTACVMSVLR